MVGSPMLAPLTAGSGGGGGGGSTAITDEMIPGENGAGGGAGGGAVHLLAGGFLRVGGMLNADGGRGGQGPDDTVALGITGGGGGGSGGGILLQGTAGLEVTGWLRARGGFRGLSNNQPPGVVDGGSGSPGYIRFERGLGSPPATRSSGISGPVVVRPLSIPSIVYQAQSRWYFTGGTNPTFTAPIITATPASSGALGTLRESWRIEFQGADDLGGLPDLGSLTSWESDVTLVSSKEHVRFRVDLTTTFQAPRIDEIEIPWF